MRRDDKGSFLLLLPSHFSLLSVLKKEEGMNIDRVFAIVGSALDAQRQRLNIIAGNLANAESTRTPGGGPYIRRDVVFQAISPEQS